MRESPRSHAVAADAGLKALSNIEPGFSPMRTAVVLVDASESSAAATQWAVKQWWRKGDAVHLVHAVCCLLPKLEIYHSASGSPHRLLTTPFPYAPATRHIFPSCLRWAVAGMVQLVLH